MLSQIKNILLEKKYEKIFLFLKKTNKKANFLQTNF